MIARRLNTDHHRGDHTVDRAIVVVIEAVVYAGQSGISDLLLVDVRTGMKLQAWKSPSTPRTSSSTKK